MIMSKAVQTVVVVVVIVVVVVVVVVVDLCSTYYVHRPARCQGTLSLMETSEDIGSVST